MLTKITLIAILFVLSCGAAVAGGVTNIREVINNTGQIVEVRKYDVKALGAATECETTGEIPANGGTWSGDMWVPWADNATDFTDKRMEVKVYRGTAFWIWQTGEFVRFNDRARFVANARRVTGEAKSGGARRLVISLNKAGNVVFEFQRL